jgi:hypothetical protein
MAKVKLHTYIYARSLFLLDMITLSRAAALLILSCSCHRKISGNLIGVPVGHGMPSPRVEAMLSLAFPLSDRVWVSETEPSDDLQLVPVTYSTSNNIPSLLH